MKKLLSLLFVLVSLLCLASCGGNDEKTIVVGATPSPHAEILNSKAVQDYIKSKGYTLVVKVYQDYPFVAEVIDNSIIDKNGEGKVLKKFTNRDALDAFADELISKGYVNYQSK